MRQATASQRLQGAALPGSSAIKAEIEKRADPGSPVTLDCFQHEGRWHGHAQWMEDGSSVIVVVRGLRSPEALARALRAGVDAIEVRR